MHCPKCGFDSVPTGARFCPECGTKVAESSTPTAQITVSQDVGTVEGGEVTGLTIGQIKGDVTIITTLGELDAVDESAKLELKRIYEAQIRKSPEQAQNHLALGLYYLDLGMHSRAIDSLTKAHERGPREASILYYLALASIGGRRPKTLTLSDVKSVESYLGAAVSLDSSQAHYLYLWALIKYDYYLANGLRPSPPTIEELIAAGQSGTFVHAEMEQMFKHVPVPESPITEVILARW